MCVCVCVCGCNEVCASVYENVCTVFVSACESIVWVSLCMNVGEFGVRVCMILCVHGSTRLV